MNIARASGLTEMAPNKNWGMNMIKRIPMYPYPGKRHDKSWNVFMKTKMDAR